MGAPNEILDLIGRFREQYDSYRLPSYGETEIRREFIDPFFAALGWDVDNKQGNAEAYKDVVHEDSIMIGGSTKAPDYSFRIGGVRKFFVEAKKPSVNIGQDISPAFQLRRYGWSAKLPLSILTDFEEFAVYDCRVRPDKNDKASTARIMYLKFEDYDTRWDEIASVFSLDAIRKGSFDKYAESTKKKRGTAEVDKAFLEEIELWQSELARNLALRNDLSQRELNFAVQKTIDRIIFLRICEDRGIEHYGTLQSLLNGTKVYERLRELFRKADDRYNSGLFHFTKEKQRREDPDEWTLALKIDDKVLKEILQHLYYPDSPYEFSVVGAEILGHVYEQFLGKVIRLTSGHRAVVEDKPEVKKAGGVFYSPTYIVDYIVQQTVGNLVEGKEPHEVAGRTKTTWKPAKGLRPLSVLDPACGSGSFLLGAYQFFLDWYRDWYVGHNPAKHKDRIYQTRKDQWRLTTAERKRILVDHIYGVDIDSQAVEVTKLSLLLRVLEGETTETLQRQLFSKQRALPDLADNIKCGNSLVGPDFFNGKLIDSFDEEERLRINAFDWSGKEGFYEIMKSGGFDAVVGNPPYVRMEGFVAWKEYFRANYNVHADRTDLYAYFVEKGLSILCDSGLFSMILSNKFVKAKYGRNLRNHICETAPPTCITDFAGLPVFSGATVRTIVLTSQKTTQQRSSAVYCPPPGGDDFRQLAAGTVTVKSHATEYGYPIDTGSWKSGEWSFERGDYIEVLNKLLSNAVALSDFINGPICYGVKSGLVEAFVIPPDIANVLRKQSSESSDVVRPHIVGRDVRRYSNVTPSNFLIYTFHGIDISSCKAITDHLQPYKQRLLKRATTQEWYELQQPQKRYVELMKDPKIVYPDIAKDCRFGMDISGCVCGDTTFAIPGNNFPLLALLNSRVAYFYFKCVCAALEGGNDTYLRFKSQYVAKFPVPRELKRGQLADRLQILAQRMISLTEQRKTAKTTHEQTSIGRQIDITDAEIDRLIYEIYGLTNQEIRTVEEATAR